LDARFTPPGTGWEIVWKHYDPAKGLKYNTRARAGAISSSGL